MLSQDMVERYRRDGYVVIDDLLPAETLSSLQDRVDKLVERSRWITQSDEIYELAPGHSSERPILERIKAPHKVDEAVFDLLHHPAILEVLVALLGPNVRLQNSKLNMKSAGGAAPPGGGQTRTLNFTAAGGAAVEWHQDWAFYPHTNDDVLAIGVMLDDMTPDNGPVMMVPGSHRGPIHEHHSNGVFCGAVNDEVSAESLERAVQITGRAGSVSFHHARLLHGSGLNLSGAPRRFLLFEVMAADAWPIAGGSGPFVDWEEFSGRIICGSQSKVPRLADVPVRMPVPPPALASSIFALQDQGENRLLSKQAKARP